MFGYASWEYGTDFFDRIVVESHGGTLDGGARSGAILAGDFPFRLSEDVSLTLGGWFNHAGQSVAHDPAHIYAGLAGEIRVPVPERTLTEQSQFSSAYAGIYYRWFGVQAGVVPVRIRQTLDVAGEGITTSNRTQVDFDAFGVVRYTEREVLPSMPITITGGIGMYRYSAREASLLVNGLYDPGTASAASTVLSGYFNLNLALTPRVAVDFSAWGIGAKNDRLSDSQARATIGLGITF